MFPIVLLAAGGVVAAVLGYAATRPSTFRVERSVTIQAPPGAIIPLIEDFREWPRWSPWEKLDPEMQRTYSGSERGVGAVYEWNGDKKAGQGRLEIVSVIPERRITIALSFLRPFEAHNTTEFELKQTGDSTHVTWAMHGPANYMTKVMTVFVSMDRLIGGDYEKGLANLKAEAEARALAA